MDSVDGSVDRRHFDFLCRCCHRSGAAAVQLRRPLLRRGEQHRLPRRSADCVRRHGDWQPRDSGRNVVWSWLVETVRSISSVVSRGRGLRSAIRPESSDAVHSVGEMGSSSGPRSLGSCASKSPKNSAAARTIRRSAVTQTRRSLPCFAGECDRQTSYLPGLRGQLQPNQRCRASGACSSGVGVRRPGRRRVASR